eukprot:TRINITY_DN21851_c0_g1_i1.p4 TRINITY_DN21851_c0_g1~~TRINITY_DN21851_c0_g1_i1.p4  ORF type:complete len:134 (-),score=54.55 TRINITY_DN21851_c0_g1_i1:1030-1431(-)
MKERFQPNREQAKQERQNTEDPESDCEHPTNIDAAAHSEADEEEQPEGNAAADDETDSLCSVPRWDENDAAALLSIAAAADLEADAEAAAAAAAVAAAAAAAAAAAEAAAAEEAVQARQSRRRASKPCVALAE